MLPGGKPFPLPAQPFVQVHLGLVAEQLARPGQVGGGRIDIAGLGDPPPCGHLGARQPGDGLAGIRQWHAPPGGRR